jgi:hypothetical protein
VRRHCVSFSSAIVDELQCIVNLLGRTPRSAMAKDCDEQARVALVRKAGSLDILADFGCRPMFVLC